VLHRETGRARTIKESLANRTDRSRLGLAVLQRFFQVEGRFHREPDGRVMGFRVTLVGMRSARFDRQDWGFGTI
jgi:hypothetical protein